MLDRVFSDGFEDPLNWSILTGPHYRPIVVIQWIEFRRTPVGNR